MDLVGLLLFNISEGTGRSRCLYRDKKGGMSRSSQISELFSTMDVIYVPAGGTEEHESVRAIGHRVEEKCASEED